MTKTGTPLRVYVHWFEGDSGLGGCQKYKTAVVPLTTTRLERQDNESLILKISFSDSFSLKASSLTVALIDIALIL